MKIPDTQTLIANAVVSTRKQLNQAGMIISEDEWSYEELQHIQLAVERSTRALGGQEAFSRAIGKVSISRNDTGGGGLYALWLLPPWKHLALGCPVLHQQPSWLAQVAVVHELAHAWDTNASGILERALIILGARSGAGKIARSMAAYVGDEPGPTLYGGSNPQGETRNLAEEWAESLAAYVYPEYITWLLASNPNERDAGLKPRHRAFVESQIDRL